MRISDWSSDVCSSDLQFLHHAAIFFVRCVLLGARLAADLVQGEPLQSVLLHDRRFPLWLSRPRRRADRLQLVVEFRFLCAGVGDLPADRSEEHTSELQSLMRISYAVFCLKKKK